MKSVLLATLLLPGLCFSFPKEWVGVWEGSQLMGVGYTNVVVEFAAESAGYVAFEFLANANSYVYAFTEKDVVQRDGYYEISLATALEGETANLEFKLLLMPESAGSKMTAALLMFDQDRTFFVPTTVGLIKPEDERSSLKIYERIAAHKAGAAQPE